MDARPSPCHHESRSPKRWFWATLAVGALPPTIGYLALVYGFRLNFPSQHQSSLGSVVAYLLFLEAACLWPFFILAAIIRWRLSKYYEGMPEPGGLLRTKMISAGAIVGMDVHSAWFWTIVGKAPFLSTYERFDMGGMGQVMAMYVFNVVPGLGFGPAAGLIAAALGGAIGWLLHIILAMWKRG